MATYQRKRPFGLLYNLHSRQQGMLDVIFVRSVDEDEEYTALNGRMRESCRIGVLR